MPTTHGFVKSKRLKHQQAVQYFERQRTSV